MTSLFSYQNILNIWNYECFPINLLLIAEKLNFIVQDTSFEDDTTLLIYNYINNKHIIYIDRNNTSNNLALAFLFSSLNYKQNLNSLTITKSHFLKNGEDIKTSLIQNDIINYLIQKNLLLIAIKQGHTSIEQLAKKFDVSERLMYNGIKKYKIF